MWRITPRNRSLIPSPLRPLDRFRLADRVEDGDGDEAEGAGERKRGRRTLLRLANLVALV